MAAPEPERALKILTILLFMVAFVSRDTAYRKGNLFVMILSVLSDFKFDAGWITL